MISPEQFTSLCQAIPGLRELSPSAQVEVQSEAAYLSFPKGQILFDDGAECPGFLVVTEGQVRVAKSIESGREILLYRVFPGDACILTVSCLLGGVQYPAEGAAETPLKGVLLPKGLFNDLIAKSESFRQMVFNVLGRRVVELMMMVEEVAFHRLDQRLARLLSRHAARHRSADVCVTHQQLSDELGTSREIVSRVLATLEDQGMVELGRKRITIVQGDELASLGDKAPA